MALVVRADARFSPDETSVAGQDTGTPVDEYAYRMPFPFTGTLTRLVTVLPSKLSAEEQRRLHEELAKAIAAVHRLV